jgi:hypothetical protein
VGVSPPYADDGLCFNKKRPGPRLSVSVFLVVVLVLVLVLILSFLRSSVINMAKVFDAAEGEGAHSQSQGRC